MFVHPPCEGIHGDSASMDSTKGGGRVRSGTAARPRGFATLEDPSALWAEGGPGFTHQFSRGRLVGLRGHSSTPNAAGQSGVQAWTMHSSSQSQRCLHCPKVTASQLRLAIASHCCELIVAESTAGRWTSTTEVSVLSREQRGRYCISLCRLTESASPCRPSPSVPPKPPAIYCS